MLRLVLVPLTALLGLCLCACASTNEKMVATGTPDAAPLKYRNAFAVRSVTGECNISAGGIKPLICVQPPIKAQEMKEALEKSLAANGYLASGTPRFYVDMAVQELRTPIFALDVEATSSIIYSVIGAGSTQTFPIKTAGTAKIADMPIGSLRAQYAIMYALKENFSEFMKMLR